MSSSNTSTENKAPVIFYHANCPDGLAAASVFHRLLRMPESAYIPSHYGVAPTQDVTDRMVYILDFTFSPEITKELVAKAREVHLLDHHHAAVEKLREVEGLNIFSPQGKQLSGVGLAWEFIHEGERILPKLYAHIQDRDLWKKELVDTEEVCCALNLLPRTVHAFANLGNDYAEIGGELLGYGQIVKLGRYLLMKQKADVQQHMKLAYEVVFAGHEHDPVLACNAHGMFASDLGEALAKDRLFSVTYYDLGDGRRKYSLRSNANGSNFDVCKLANQFGGGGHRNAAGFYAPVPEATPPGHQVFQIISEDE